MSSPNHSGLSAPITQVAIAFFILYVVWGSTYLGIAVSIETLPPLLLGAGRFIIAGVLFYVVLRISGTPAPTSQHWRSATVSGLLLFLGGNGLVSWAEHVVPSGITALIVAITPLWMTLLPWMAGRTERPTLPVFLGITLGFFGVVILVGTPSSIANQLTVYLSMSAIVLASFLWACGSLAAKALPLPASPWMSAAAQMICGGIGMGVVGLLIGERVELEAVSARSWAAFIYLTAIGSIVGFGAYIYLLKHTTMTRVSTYAFVNPIVAVALGWFIANEPIGPRTIFAGVLIIIAVILILRRAPAPTLNVSKQEKPV